MAYWDMIDRVRGVRDTVERVGFRLQYLLTDLAYAVGIPTPKRSLAGTYWSYEITNPHADDPGLCALDALPADAIIADVGAHIGEYAIPLAKSTQRRVYAFEPNAATFARLNRTIARNDLVDRIEVRRIGIADRDDCRPFYRSSYSKLSSFNQQHATRWGACVTSRERVPVRRLDTLVSESMPPPDGIKIDVEGLEQSVLQGARRTIAEHRPRIILELHDEQEAGTIVAWLTDREYTVDRSDATLIADPDGQECR